MRNIRNIALLLTLIFVLFSLTAQMNTEREDIRTVKINAKYEATPISTVLGDLMAIADVALYNQIILDHEAGETEPLITIELKDVPFIDALRKIVKSVGLTYRQIDERTFFVGDATEVKTEAAG